MTGNKIYDINERACFKRAVYLFKEVIPAEPDDPQRLF